MATVNINTTLKATPKLGPSILENYVTKEELAGKNYVTDVTGDGIYVRKSGEWIPDENTSGSGDSKKYYLHQVSFPNDSSTLTNPAYDAVYEFTITVINNDNTKLTFATLYEQYKANKVVSYRGYCRDKDDDTIYAICHILVFSTQQIILDVSGSKPSFKILSTWEVEDSVAEL